MGLTLEEYWVVNIIDDCLEVYRDPRVKAYETHRTLRRGDRVRPLCAPEIELEVAELLP